MRPFLNSFLVVAALSLAVIGNARAQAAYTVTDLGVINGASTSNAWGINALGQVVGRQYTIGVGYSAFLWENGQMTDFGIPPGYTGSHAVAINALGDVAGTLETANGKAAFKRTGNQLTDLGVLGTYGGIADSRGYSINASGAIVGSSTSASGYRAFLWQSGQMTNLGTLPGGFHSEADGINSSGQVAGTTTMGNGFRATLWSGGQTTFLGALWFDGSGGCDSQAHAISDVGQVAGDSQMADGTRHLFVWDDLDLMQDLGKVGDTIAIADSINTPGDIVGRFTAASASRAFIWNQITGFRDLNTLIPSNSGWVLIEGHSINDSGQIVGEGTHNGQMRAFLLTPASTLALASLTVDPARLTGWQSATGTVTLTESAPAGGVTVALASDTPGVTVPASVLIPENASSATFTVSTSLITTDVDVLITASYGGRAEGAVLSVEALVPISLAVSPQPSVKGGANITSKVTFSGPAPTPSGIIFTYQLDDTGDGVFDRTWNSGGSIIAGLDYLNLSTSSIPVALDTVVTARATYNGVSVTGQTVVLAPVPASLTVAPASVYGGVPSTGTVTIDGPAPAGGLAIPLGLNNWAAASVPANVVIPAGQTTATFTITTYPVAVTTNDPVAAFYDPDGSGPKDAVVQSAVLTVKEAQLLGISFSPSNVVKGGTTTNLVFTLTSPAPSGGATVSLTTTDKKLLPLPKSITVPAGQKSATLSIKTGRATVNTNVTVTGTWKTITRTATATITP